MAPFTGSSFGRVLECAASAVLPQTRDDSPNVARDRGTTFHRFAHRASQVGRDAALAEIPLDDPGRALCEAFDLDELPIDYLAAEVEVAIAYDVDEDSARYLYDENDKPIESREYHKASPPLRASEIPMTLDALEWAGGATVSDLKTGRRSSMHKAQLDLGALAASRLEPHVTDHRCQAIYISEGGVSLAAWDADVEDVRRDVVGVVAAIRRMGGTEITLDDVSPGDHCEYCSAKSACPARVEAANDLAVIQPAALATFDASIATAEGAAQWWERLPILEEMLAAMRERLDARALSEPFTLESGETVGAVKTERRNVRNGDAVFRIMSEMVGADAANAATKVERSATLGAIEKAAGKAKTEVVEALTAAGAIGMSVSVKAGIVKARKGRAA